MCIDTAQANPHAGMPRPLIILSTLLYRAAHGGLILSVGRRMANLLIVYQGVMLVACLMNRQSIQDTNFPWW